MDREQLKMLPKGEVIKIRGANEHNLKNIDLDIPRNKICGADRTVRFRKVLTGI